MTLKERILSIQRMALCFIRCWWRPIMLAGVGLGTWVNLIIIPLWKREVPDMAEAAAWIAACGALSWVREWGKTKGNTEA